MSFRNFINYETKTYKRKSNNNLSEVEKSVFDTIEEMIDEENKKHTSSKFTILHDTKIISPLRIESHQKLTQGKIISTTELKQIRNNILTSHKNLSFIPNIQKDYVMDKDEDGLIITKMIKIAQPIRGLSKGNTAKLSSSKILELNYKLEEQTGATSNKLLINVNKSESEPSSIFNSRRESKKSTTKHNEEVLRKLEKEEAENDEKSNSSVVSPANKRWRKVSNFFRSISSFRKYGTKNIESDVELDNDMLDYKDRLFPNTVRMRDDEEKKVEKEGDSLLNRINQMNSFEKENYQLYLKKCIYNELVDCNVTSTDINKEINKLLNKNPVYITDYSDPSCEFNKPLENGQTLFYVACKEGNIEAIKTFLAKKLNPTIKSKIGPKLQESPLSVACRWGLTRVVKFLLENIKYVEKDIKETLKIKNLNKEIEKMLKQYLTHRGKNTFLCCYSI